MVKMKMIAGLVVLCLASAVAAFFLPNTLGTLLSFVSMGAAAGVGVLAIVSFVRLLTQRRAFCSRPYHLRDLSRVIPPKAQGAPMVLRALFVVPLLAATTQKHRAVPMAQPYAYHRPRINSRTRPRTVSSTPPSSIASATFHTSRRSFFPAWGSCM